MLQILALESHCTSAFPGTAMNLKLALPFTSSTRHLRLWIQYKWFIHAMWNRTLLFKKTGFGASEWRDRKTFTPFSGDHMLHQCLSHVCLGIQRLALLCRMGWRDDVSFFPVFIHPSHSMSSSLKGCDDWLYVSWMTVICLRWLSCDRVQLAGGRELSRDQLACHHI